MRFFNRTTVSLLAAAGIATLTGVGSAQAAPARASHVASASSTASVTKLATSYARTCKVSVAGKTATVYVVWDYSNPNSRPFSEAVTLSSGSGTFKAAQWWGADGKPAKQVSLMVGYGKTGKVYAGPYSWFRTTGHNHFVRTSVTVSGQTRTCDVSDGK